MHILSIHWSCQLAQKPLIEPTIAASRTNPQKCLQLHVLLLNALMFEVVLATDPAFFSTSGCLAAFSRASTSFVSLRDVCVLFGVGNPLSNERPSGIFIGTPAILATSRHPHRSFFALRA